MITFYEGLPRSGKSYEVTTKHILVALEKGRKVFAYIEGLNHEKFAEVTGLPINIIKMLLVQVKAEDVKTIYELVENDSLVVIDEAQDFFPTDRAKLTVPMTEFITQHGHKGLDIILMGQDMRDVHVLWRRRVENKVEVVKRGAVGLENQYTWKMFKKIGTDKYQKITSGSGKYEKKYFGLYSSHVNDEINTANYQDDRAIVWKTPAFMFGLPACVITGIWGIVYLVGYFHVDPEALKPKTDPVVVVVEPQVVVPVKVEKVELPEPLPVYVHVPVKVDPIPVPEVKPIDYIDKLARKYRARLSGIVSFHYKDNEQKMYEYCKPTSIHRYSFICETRLLFVGYVDFYDSAFHLKERLNLAQVAALGWDIEQKVYGVEITKENTNTREDVNHVITAWPMDAFGKVSDRIRQSPQVTGYN